MFKGSNTCKFDLEISDSDVASGKSLLRFFLLRNFLA